MSPCGLRSLARMLWLACLASCLVWPGDPVSADTANPPPTQRMYTPAPAVNVQVQVPDLRQRLLSDAQKVATDAHLRLQVSGDAPSDASKFLVVRQTPEPKTTVPAGTTVTVVVQATASRQTPPSRVPERITVVPDLVKHSLLEARPLMETARLKLEVSGGAPEDTSHAIVMDQKPAAGTRVIAGSTVVVTVQLQRTVESTIVPDVQNRRVSEAQPLVSRAGLRLDVGGGMPEDPSRATVVTQKPPPGTRVRLGSTVMVSVKTEELVVVPDLVPQILPDAQGRIRDNRLRLEVSGGWPADPSRAIVVEQNPAKGTRVPLNSIVMVRVRPLPTRPTNPPPAPQPAPTGPPQLGTTGPPQLGTTTPAPPGTTSPAPPVDEWVLVPGLVQRPLMDALSQVRSRRLRLEVAGGWPSGPEHTVVAGQSPTEGTRVRIGSAVTVQISPAGQAMQPTPPPPQPPPAAAPAPQVSPPPPAAPPRPPARADLVLVPDLLQQLLPEARQLTTSARLELRVRGQSPADETRTIVTSQRPAAGARVAAKSIVFVELGPALLAVPDLRKHPLDEARQMVSRAGFELAIMGDPPSNESRANVVEQTPLPGVRAVAGSTVTVRAKASLLTTWVMAGAGALLAAGAALGIARWRGVGHQAAPGVPGVRVVANSDVGKQEISANGAAAEGFALRLRSRIDAGSQTVDATTRIVAAERRVDA